MYGLLVWRSTYPTFLGKLSALQNKAVKLIAGGKPRDSPTKFYFESKIIKLSDLYKVKVAKFVRAHFSKTILAQITDYFTKSNEISKRVTRASKIQPNMLYMPHYQTTRLQSCIKYQGVKI